MKKTFLLELIFLCAVSLLLGGCLSTSVREDEKLLLITIEDLAVQGIAVGTPSQEGVNYSARRFANGTIEVEYEYDSANDPANDEVVLFYSEADVYRNEALAITAFSDAIEAYKLGAALGNSDVEVIGIPNQFLLGDQNYSAYLESGGSYFGNMVVARKGAMVYSLLLAGPYIKYSETLQNLIGPKLELAGK